MKTLLLGEETELEIQGNLLLDMHLSNMQATNLVPSSFQRLHFLFLLPFQGDKFLHNLRIARNFPPSVQEMLVFGDRDAKGCHCQLSY